jgi:1,4-alpha-glucan branching enzyme
MKGSLFGKMPGDEWQKLANLRLLYAYMWAQPGKKLLFMGGELGQVREWNHDASLDWHLADEPRRAGLQRWVEALNRLYRSSKALHELDTDPAGFEWIDCNDADASVVTFMRKSRDGDPVIVALNFTPVPRYGYQVGVPEGGYYRELLNSDAHDYGGSGHGNMGGVDATPNEHHGRPWSLSLTLPPLGALFLQRRE